MAVQETPKAAAAYAEYEQLGRNRSLAALAIMLGQQQGKAKVNISLLEQWSSKYGWVARVRAYDEAKRERERQRREEEEEAERQRQRREIAQMNQRHAQIGVSLQAKALKQVEALIEAQKFGSQATVMALKLALDTERLARGEATERQEQQQQGTLVLQLTLESVQQMAEQAPDHLAAWRKKRGLPPPVSEEHLA